MRLPRNIKPLLLKTSEQEREMIQEIRKDRGLATETAVIRQLITQAYMDMAQKGKGYTRNTASTKR